MMRLLRIAVGSQLTTSGPMRSLTVFLSGSVLRNEGLRHRTPGDLSSPGVAVALV